MSVVHLLNTNRKNGSIPANRIGNVGNLISYLLFLFMLVQQLSIVGNHKLRGLLSDHSLFAFTRSSFTVSTSMLQKDARGTRVNLAGPIFSYPDHFYQKKIGPGGPNFGPGPNLSPDQNFRDIR